MASDLLSLLLQPAEQLRCVVGDDDVSTCNTGNGKKKAQSQITFRDIKPETQNLVVAMVSSSSSSHLPGGRRSWLPSRRPAGRRLQPALRATSWQTPLTRCTPPGGEKGTGERCEEKTDTSLFRHQKIKYTMIQNHL